MNLRRRFEDYLYQQQFTPTHSISIFYDPGFLIHLIQFRQIKLDAQTISGSVLDFGCGSKPYEKLFDKADKYTGIDTNSSGHNHSRSRVDVYYDGSILPFKDSEFDHVAMFDVLEHLDNPEVSLAEIYRVLKPGGLLIGTVPFCYPLHETPNDYLRYTDYGIDNYLSGKGFAKRSIIRILPGYASILQSLIASQFEGGKVKSQILKRIFLSPFLFFMNLFGILFLPINQPNSIYSSHYFVFEKK